MNGPLVPIVRPALTLVATVVGTSSDGSSVSGGDHRTRATCLHDHLRVRIGIEDRRLAEERIRGIEVVQHVEPVAHVLAGGERVLAAAALDPELEGRELVGNRIEVGERRVLPQHRRRGARLRRRHGGVDTGDTEEPERTAVEVVGLEDDGVVRRTLRQRAELLDAQVIAAVRWVSQTDRGQRIAPIDGATGDTGRIRGRERIGVEVADVEGGDLVADAGLDETRRAERRHVGGEIGQEVVVGRHEVVDALREHRDDALVLADGRIRAVDEVDVVIRGDEARRVDDRHERRGDHLRRPRRARDDRRASACRPTTRDRATRRTRRSPAGWRTRPCRRSARRTPRVASRTGMRAWRSENPFRARRIRRR